VTCLGLTGWESQIGQGPEVWSRKRQLTKTVFI
jgi:hypothetical protein